MPLQISGKADLAENLSLTAHELGCQARCTGEGWALRKIEPSSGPILFTLRYKTLASGGGNAFLAFGETPDNENLVKCGTFMGAGIHSIFQGPKARYAEGVKKNFSGEKTRVFEIRVRIDPADRRITMTTGDGELAWGLPESVGVVRYMGFWGWNMNAAFDLKWDALEAPAGSIKPAAPLAAGEAKAKNQTGLAQHPEAAGGTETAVFANPEGVELKLACDKPLGAGPFPVVVYVHGGGWGGGDEKQFLKFSQNLTHHGVAGIRINYRKVPQRGTAEKAMADVLAAVQWARDNASRLHLDLKRVGLAGGSAGGHLAALAAQLVPECIAFAGFNGGYDMFERGNSSWPSADLRQKFLGSSDDEAVLKKYSALWNIKTPPPESLLLHGTADTTITPDVAVRFCEALKKKGGKATLSLYEGMPHSFFNATKFLETDAEARRHFCRVFGLPVP